MEMIIGMIKIMTLNMCTLRIQDYFEWALTLFLAIRAPNSLDPDHFGGPEILVCKAEDIIAINVSLISGLAPV